MYGQVSILDGELGHFIGSRFCGTLLDESDYKCAPPAAGEIKPSIFPSLLVEIPARIVLLFMKT